ncbi:CBS domain-containing protein [Pyxidicoccus fallax]|uniref:CBS domain-containing protein n=1 Tax=Pyxidicoccus fallax TaxID=394095 RepID=A0A848L4Z8_9BACT|nr:CBS domain-containing protein [Pyxidicoccus fallax]NMO14040.1 CBS domain-containing protein [Pyxidicoccus fallax]NPC85396.1 CBS domain-containing protein [Pyxidicoccus fallax]
MARSLDNGKDDTRTAQRNPPMDPGMHRSADVAPPGSRERGESDLTGWNPARDEEPTTRQGRYHRAASLRMAQPRTHVDDRGTEGDFGTRRTGMMNMDDRDAGWEGAEYARGPYGRDDRDTHYATGRGPRHDAGTYENELPPQRADYRPWDRYGYGGEEPMRGPRTEPYRDERSRLHEGFQRGDDRYSEQRQRGDDRQAEERQRVGDRIRGEDRGQYYTAGTRGRTGTGTRTGRRRWQREPLTAREVMTRNVRTARLDSPVRDVAQIMKDEDCGVVPVVNERGSLVGIVTDRDLVIRGFTGGKTPDQLRVSDVMTDDVEAVTPDDNIHDVIALMGRKQIRRIPVVERDDRIVGIISMGDIANRADYDEELQEALDRVSSKRSFWSRLG